MSRSWPAGRPCQEGPELKAETPKEQGQGPAEPEWDRDMDVSPEELEELRLEQGRSSGAASSGLQAQASATAGPSSGSAFAVLAGPSEPHSGSATAAAGLLPAPAVHDRTVGAAPAAQPQLAPAGPFLLQPCCCNLLRIVYGEILAMRAELAQARADMVHLARRNSQ